MGEREGEYCPLSVEIRGKVYCFTGFGDGKECNHCTDRIRKHDLQRGTMAITDSKREQ